jgi:uncharacterized protein (DUF983 family)
MAVSPVIAGVRCRCPNCGEGRLFERALRFKDRCDVCEADFTIADVGDGGAFFVSFLALALIVPAAMIVEFALAPPVWLHVILWPPLTTFMCVALLRPMKATLFALQWVNKAGEVTPKDLH